jgi:ADP-L-glycero-D-manno-heptose 6-epimerase
MSNMYIVTGGAGFIGSTLVRALNDRGISDVIVVDDLTQGDKCRNLADCTLADYWDIAEFRTRLQSPRDLPSLAGILHQGACADTTESNGRYMMDNNFAFSREVLHLALENHVPLVYASSASVYGAGEVFAEEPANERPLNVYAWSKLVFDQYVRRHLDQARSTVVGLRYFNVYGARETFKGRMASMVHQLYHQLRDTGIARLFDAYGGYGAGEQKRDFVYVGDVVDVNLHFLDGPTTKGIFNVGSGEARTFNSVAKALIDQVGGKIEYIPFPESLRGKYQCYTEADLTRLREAGYDRPMTSLEDGAKKLAEELQREQ